MRLRSLSFLTWVKQSLPLFVSVIFSIFSCSLLSAQEGDLHVKSPQNGIGVYVGILEINLNYERKIFQQSKSCTNVRIGVGSWTDMQSGGKYMNTSIIQLVGRKKSKIEFDLGLKIFPSGTNLQLEPSKTFLIADIYLGYYYESQKSREYFRAGFSFPSLFNIGGGLRF